MPAPQGLILFSGIPDAAIMGGDFTLSHGADPSVCTLTVPRGTQVGRHGFIVILYGGKTITFTDCYATSSTAQSTLNGRTATVQILDRRWRWQNRLVWGIFNIRNAAGTIEPETFRTPQQMAALLFLALGEPPGTFNVADLPNDVPPPQVNWVGANAADELASLVEGLGCRIVPKLNGTFHVNRVGAGGSLPGGGVVMNESNGIQPATVPDKIVLLGGPARFQRRILLWPIAEDTDGTHKLIDEVSYKPTGGWDSQSSLSFSGIADPTARALALRDVYRKWAIFDPSLASDNNLQPPGLEPDDVLVNQPWQVLPINDKLLDTYTESDGTTRPKAAYLSGRFWDGNYTGASTPADTVYGGRFSVDAARGWFITEEPMIEIIGGAEIGAELYATFTHPVRDPDTRQFLRYELKRTIGPDPLDAHAIRRDDLVWGTRAAYSTGTTVSTITTNQALLATQGNKLIDAELLNYANETSEDREYAEIISIELDGAIQQVSWTVGSGGATTRASRNAEFSVYARPHAQRRRLRRARQVERKTPGVAYDVTDDMLKTVQGLA